MSREIEIFFSYAHEDEKLMHDVRRQLVVYERSGRILKWHDRKIPPGTNWRNSIDARLSSARVVLLFVSPHFMDSRYCYEVEGKEALRRHKEGTARVVPIILRPCSWQEAPFGKLEALPRGAKAVSQWRNRDEACLDVANGVMAVVDDIVAEENTAVPGKRPPSWGTESCADAARVSAFAASRGNATSLVHMTVDAQEPPSHA